MPARGLRGWRAWAASAVAHALLAFVLVYLPAPRNAPTQAPPVDVESSPRRVLVVEDEPDAREMLVLVLEGAGHAVQTRHRVSGSCRQDGPLPNLAITGVSAHAGDSPGTELYAIDVANEGVAPASAVTVDIFVDSAQADTATVDEIDPGQTVTVHITGPACSQHVRAVVDRRALINETTDGDNVVRAGCPPAAS